MDSINTAVEAWQTYFKTVKNWEDLIVGIEPKLTGCGPVYELPNPIDRPSEDLAIADMRHLDITDAHYHANGDTEIYIILQGGGLVVVGEEEHQVKMGSVIITPSGTTHFTVPGKDLVLAVINTPPFSPQNYVIVTETNDGVGFNSDQYARHMPKP